MNDSQVSVPLSVRLRFGHAAVQRVADRIGVDLLHIKGAAVDPSLRPGGYSGSDVDVLVRPSHVDALDQALREHGWTLYSTFVHGSPFGHAQTYLHNAWGYIDLHRYFPGIRLEPAAAFELFWADGRTVEIAGVGCRVPDLAAQSALLVLNAARSAKGARADVLNAWANAGQDRRAEISRLVQRLHADVAFAAATGDLDRYRRDREYRLWKVVSEGGPRSAEWWARILAAPSLGAAAALAFRATLVNVDHLAHRIGRPPTRLDILLEFFRRPVAGIGEVARSISRRIRLRRDGAA